MMEELLRAVVAASARHVIVDLTGVDAVDASTADHLVRVVASLSLIGARAVVSGIQPGVANSIVGLGVDLSRIATARNLKEAIRLSTRRH
jgi:anti-anti-sigma regulatory factor